mmetsp:Transcript_17257/g.51441  ORF Transcript_17257/g.51441 Transcript_17257/m.51441 type:complete len:291 (-) Transcript_17257:662-1534(-)
MSQRPAPPPIAPPAMSVMAWKSVPPAMKSLSPQSAPPALWRHIVGGLSRWSANLSRQLSSAARGRAATTTEPCRPSASSCDRTARNESKENRNPVGGGGPVVVAVVVVAPGVVVAVVARCVVVAAWLDVDTTCSSGRSCAPLLPSPPSWRNLPTATAMPAKGPSPLNLRFLKRTEPRCSSSRARLSFSPMNQRASGMPRAAQRCRAASRPSPDGMPLPINALATRKANWRCVTATTWASPSPSKSTYGTSSPVPNGSLLRSSRTKRAISRSSTRLPWKVGGEARQCSSTG